MYSYGSRRHHPAFYIGHLFTLLFLKILMKLSYQHQLHFVRKTIRPNVSYVHKCTHKQHGQTECMRPSGWNSSWTQAGYPATIRLESGLITRRISAWNTAKFGQISEWIPPRFHPDSPRFHNADNNKWNVQVLTEAHIINKCKHFWCFHTYTSIHFFFPLAKE